MIAIREILRYSPSALGRLLFQVVAILIASSACKMFIVLITGAVLNKLSNSPSGAGSGILAQFFASQNIFGLCFMLGLLAVSVTCLGILSAWALGNYVSRVSVELSKECMNTTLNLPYIQITQRDSKHFISDINKVGGVVSGTISPIIQIVGATLTIGGAFIAAIIVNWKVTLIAGFLGASMYVVAGLLSKWKLEIEGEKIVKDDRLYFEILSNALENTETIIFDEKQEEVVADYSSVSRNRMNSRIKVGVLQIIPRYILEGAAYLSIAVACALQAKYNDSGLNIGVIGSLALAIQNILPNMQQIYSCWSTYQSSKGNMRVVLALLDSGNNSHKIDRTWPDKRFKLNNQFDIKKMVNRLDFANVKFRYTENVEGAALINDIKLTIKKGECIGLIGKTGSGKSTLLRLLSGLLEATDGDILVDNKSIYASKQARRSWMSQIAYVSQSSIMINTTIIENIVPYGDVRNVDSERLRLALEVSKVNEFATRLENGLDTEVGDHGAKLSGGQRQRVAIARALYRKDKSILILDEATTGLDSVTETEVLEGLKKNLKDMTIIMITHKLENLKFCDRVFEVTQQNIYQRKS